MARQVIILHGWSDSSKSFKALAKFLDEHGFTPHAVHLGDYISMDDEVRVEDVSRRMRDVIRQRQDEGTIDASFDMIVHSTGGLVARQWIADLAGLGLPCPLKRLVMLAPANFGSALAVKGKSLLGRILKGGGNWFQTGKAMLDALELASPYQWKLASQDLFVPAGKSDAPSPYGDEGVWPFVVVGSHPYSDLLRKIVNENGSDGTVRVCAANLNARGMTIDFSSDPENPEVTPWTLRNPELRMPLAVLLDRDHGSITRPDTKGVNAGDPNLLGELILQALRCGDLNEYSAIGQQWDAITEGTGRLAGDKNSNKDSRAFYHQYFQVVVRAVDDQGNDIEDFFLEFGGADKNDRLTGIFHTEVLEKVSPNQTNPALRCLYVDRNDLFELYYDQIKDPTNKVLTLTVSAAPPGPNVAYLNQGQGRIKVHSEHVDVRDNLGELRMRRNTTHFLKLVIPRTPKDDVFKLRVAP
ncbi:hypothetical protein NNJEOMEG_02356 [Fundidesulfovibrio magnetotacticus]|uniref:AB hydrolase-1 domain-containing protein n=1 Tax=Fundidesulfovibrio magnetotacticus TaxID=2730080 RepID=A0A6V8LU80_9BACT|nr:alpha/beta fold hydrolase [Fundidesulfovibrio magnetotacticus]GFK94510.1 hypothetical protein NNJEOMEG_02356 [Fundidesulfovibrio magnetotacticus]